MKNITTTFKRPPSATHSTNLHNNNLPPRLRGRDRKELIAIGLIILATLVLYAIGASKNGYANSFYAQAVQAGTVSWRAMLFGSLDAGNFVTVDKPPFALWIMEISTRIFGFHTWSMLLPEVLAGAGTVYLVYATVRRWFSARQALLAAGTMTLTPVAALMFGFNNPDAILTLLLAGSVYAVVRALENIHPVRWLSLAAFLTGCAFNTKMLQGLVVLPVLALVYLFVAQPRFLTRLKHLLLAGIVLAVAGLWWPLVVSLTPASSRPYIGSSTDNSIWNLIVGYNGLGRLTGSDSGNGGGKGTGGFSGNRNRRFGNGTPPIGTMPTRTGTPSNFGGRFNGTAPGGNFGGTPPTGAGATRPTGTMTGGAGRSGPGGTGFGGSTGVLRIFNTDFGPNIAWLTPASLIGSGLVIAQRRRRRRTDRQRAAIWLWGGYALIHIVVFSITSGTIHPYYVAVMAPAVAALIGITIPELAAAFRRGGSAALLMPLTVGLTAVTAFRILGYSPWLPWLQWAIVIGAAITIVTMVIQIFSAWRRFSGTILIAAAIICAAAPTAYALNTITLAHTGSIPTAGPSDTGMAGSNNETSSAETALISYLEKNQAGATWLVAVASANTSAPIQLSSGQPVMAVGGFNGSDNAITLAGFKQLVTDGKLKYYAVSSGGSGRSGMGGNSAILSWVESTGTKVSYGGSQYTLYKLNV